MEPEVLVDVPPIHDFITKEIDCVSRAHPCAKPHQVVRSAVHHVFKKQTGNEAGRLELADGENQSVTISSRGTELCHIESHTLTQLVSQAHGLATGASACEGLEAYMLYLVNDLNNEQQSNTQQIESQLNINACNNSIHWHEYNSEMDNESSTYEEVSTSYGEQEYHYPCFTRIPWTTDINYREIKIRFNGRPWRETDESDNNRQQCYSPSLRHSSDSDL